jgi:hypothetical protein
LQAHQVAEQVLVHGRVAFVLAAIANAVAPVQDSPHLGSAMERIEAPLGIAEEYRQDALLHFGEQRVRESRRWRLRSAFP